MIDIPVYLFTGFLESGKTTFIQETLEDEYFNNGEKTLILLCEDGEEELDKPMFASQNVYIEYIENAEEISEEYLRSVVENYEAERVIIEYNGMWELDVLIKNTPEEWILYQNMMFADATTFMTFNANMRNLVADKLKLCDAVVFNRFDDDMDKMEYHKIVRTFNRKADIMYEFSPDRVEADDIQDPLPYDMNSPVIEIMDDDYAVWYRDVNEETANYRKKTVRLKGRILLGGGLPPDCFVLGRHVMTCCVEDIEFCGVVCRINKTLRRSMKRYDNGDWVTVQAIITEERHKTYNDEYGPVLNVVKIEVAKEPEEEVAVFY